MAEYYRDYQKLTVDEHQQSCGYDAAHLAQITLVRSCIVKSCRTQIPKIVFDDAVRAAGTV